MLYSIYHCDCELSCHDIRDHQSGSQKTYMFVHEVIRHTFMLDIHDFQTKKDLLAFHNHLPLKVRKFYVEHTGLVQNNYMWLVILSVNAMML